VVIDDILKQSKDIIISEQDNNTNDMAINGFVDKIIKEWDKDAKNRRPFDEVNEKINLLQDELALISGELRSKMNEEPLKKTYANGEIVKVDYLTLAQRNSRYAIIENDPRAINKAMLLIEPYSSLIYADNSKTENPNVLTTVPGYTLSFDIFAFPPITIVEYNRSQYANGKFVSMSLIPTAAGYLDYNNYNSGGPTESAMWALLGADRAAIVAATTVTAPAANPFTTFSTGTSGTDTDVELVTPALTSVSSSTFGYSNASVLTAGAYFLVYPSSQSNTTAGNQMMMIQLSASAPSGTTPNYTYSYTTIWALNGMTMGTGSVSTVNLKKGWPSATNGTILTAAQRTYADTTAIASISATSANARRVRDSFILALDSAFAGLYSSTLNTFNTTYSSMTMLNTLMTPFIQPSWTAFYSAFTTYPGIVTTDAARYSTNAKITALATTAQTLATTYLTRYDDRLTRVAAIKKLLGSVESTNGKVSGITSDSSGHYLTRYKLMAQRFNKNFGTLAAVAKTITNGASLEDLMDHNNGSSNVAADTMTCAEVKEILSSRREFFVRKEAPIGGKNKDIFSDFKGSVIIACDDKVNGQTLFMRARVVYKGTKEKNLIVGTRKDSRSLTGMSNIVKRFANIIIDQPIPVGFDIGTEGKLRIIKLQAGVSLTFHVDHVEGASLADDTNGTRIPRQAIARTGRARTGRARTGRDLD